jgi:hypothetical protein
MNIKELKAFGYEVFEVTGWNNGKYCFSLRDIYGVYHDSYSPCKTKEKAWESAARWHAKHFPPEKIVLFEERRKLRATHYKEMKAMDKKLKDFGVKK